ncbi:SAV_915 family protein [Streptomyces sp. NPDC048664]|uniref:SAV_915 family protein n=1 Tax=Streptomyces sp. NPDC048664 TaxID=3154505 RepID=UPI003439F909
MHDILCGEDPEPCDRYPAGPLFVPVRPGPAGFRARLFRTPAGGRTAVGFTTEARLRATLGPGQRWIRLAGPALHALTAPLGVRTLTVDPRFSAPAPASGHVGSPTWTPERTGSADRRRSGDPQAVGVPRVTGAAALASPAPWIG